MKTLNALLDLIPQTINTVVTPTLNAVGNVALASEAYTSVLHESALKSKAEARKDLLKELADSKMTLKSLGLE